MMLRPIPFLLVLAACSPAPQQDHASNGEATPAADNAAKIGAPAPSHDDPMPNARESAGGAAARFVGRWAATPALCGDGAWRFEEKHLATAGEVSCDFDRVTQVADGYDVQARCLAEGTTSRETIRLRFAANDSMQVASRTFAPISLRRCAS